MQGDVEDVGRCREIYLPSTARSRELYLACISHVSPMYLPCISQVALRRGYDLAVASTNPQHLRLMMPRLESGLGLGLGLELG